MAQHHKADGDDAYTIQHAEALVATIRLAQRRIVAGHIPVGNDADEEGWARRGCLGDRRQHSAPRLHERRGGCRLHVLRCLRRALRWWRLDAEGPRGRGAEGAEDKDRGDHNPDDRSSIYGLRAARLVHSVETAQPALEACRLCAHILSMLTCTTCSVCC